MPYFLIAESGTPEDRQYRRDDVGKSSGESFAATLRQMEPDCSIALAQPSDEDGPIYRSDDLTDYDAVFITGSPMHAYGPSSAVERQLAFVNAVFRSGTPSFGSCAGMQVAVVAAGGKVRKADPRMEAGIARRIAATKEGARHPLLAGRSPVWDAPALHGDEVERLPADATLLAGNAASHVQAAEIRHERGIFWGVQYHPELSLAEIAAALRRDMDDLIEAGLAENGQDVTGQADLIDALDREPNRTSLRWRLGVDGEFAEESRRRLELANFIAALPALDRR